MTRWVGQPLARREDARLLTGRARYLDDLDLESMTYVAALRSPHAHAHIRAVDVEAARRAPGVVAAISGSDLVGTTRTFPRGPASVRPVVYYALATDRVRFVGEPVAAIVADSQLEAEDALDLVRVDYEPLAPVTSAEEAQRPNAPRLYDEWPDNVQASRRFAVGQVEEIFAAAPVVIRETFTSQRQTALPLEFRGCIAAWDGRSLTIWSSTQVPHIVRTVLAEVLQLPEPAIRVIVPDVGGGFGVKYQIFREEALVAHLARLLHRPVKWREDIREHLAASIHARDQQITLELAAREDGMILAMRAAVVADIGSGAAFPPSHGPVMVLAATCPLGLKVEHFSYSSECLVTNKCPTGAYRGFGQPVRVFAVERCLDLLAQRVGLDPADVRRRNLVSHADLPYRAVTGARIASGTFIEALDRALELIDYRRLRDEQDGWRRQGRYVGIGLASFAEGTAPHYGAHTGILGGYDSCTLRMEPDGRVTVNIGVCSQGQGHETAIAQVVADALALHPDDVVVRFGDTATTPYGLGAWGSRGAVVAAGSSAEAAARVRTKLLEVAAYLFEGDPKDVRVEGGRVWMAGLPDRSLTLREVAMAAYAGRSRLPAAMEPGLEATVFYEPAAIEPRPDPQGRVMRYATIANAAHAAVVEVLVDTGQVKLLDYVVVHDCGTIINPIIVDGQIRGGVAQGIAGALHEAIVYDDSGQLLSGTLMDYHVPKAAEVPKIRIAHLESPDPMVPGGVKGVGEGGTIGAPAAIANAVADALAPFGVRVTRTPLSPPVLLQLIAEATAHGRGA